MEADASSEPFIGAAVGGRSGTWSVARTDALHSARHKPKHVDARHSGDAALADNMVQFCAAIGGSLFPAKQRRMGNRFARRLGGVLRHWPAGRLAGIPGSGLHGVKNIYFSGFPLASRRRDTSCYESSGWSLWHHL